MAMTEADYLEQMRQLLPPGPAWDREFYGGEVDQVLQGLAPEFARIDVRADALLAELFPPTMRELVSDWEAVMGLPDECLPNDPSFDQRKAAVLRRHVLAHVAEIIIHRIGTILGEPRCGQRCERIGLLGDEHRLEVGRGHFCHW